MSAPGDTIGGSSTPEEPFSLTHGGPFHRFTRRFRRTRGEGRLALLLIVVTWVPIPIFSLFEFLLHGRYLGIVRDFSVHTRLLIAMPLLLLAERVLEERCRDCIERFRTGVGAGCDEGLKATVKRARRLRDSRLAEGLLLAAGVAVGQALLWRWRLFGGLIEGGRGGEPMSTALVWLYLVSVPLYQFLLYRALWRWTVWCFLLWRLSRMNASLLALHPDLCGGVAYFRLPILGFSLIAVAANSVLCGGWLTQIAFYGATARDFKVPFIVLVTIEVLLAYGPLAVFTDRLYRSWLRSTRTYGQLATETARLFQERWVNGARDRSLLDQEDASIMTDYRETYAVLGRLRLWPFDPRYLLRFVLVCILPALPVALTEVPLLEAMKWIMHLLTGAPVG